MMRMRVLGALAVVLSMVLSGGCTVTWVTPSPVPTPTSAPTFTPRPTITPTAVPTLPSTPIAAGTPSPTAPPTVTPTVTATRTAGPTSTPAPPLVLGHLLIPKLNLNAAVLPVPIINGDWDTKRIVMEVGWLEGTALVGSRGNIGIAAHVSLKCCGDGPFRWLERIVPGDEVLLKTDDYTYSYRVTETRVVSPTETSVLMQTGSPQLTLITCTEWDYSEAQFTKRFVVIAK
jgi:sortase A